MNKKKLSPLVIEKLQYYVYILIDPRNKNTFYIGKGKGNRIYSHINGAIKGAKSSNKIDIIQEIISKGLKVQHYIVRHGLSEKESLEVEGALIDFYGKNNLTNIVLGYNSNERGIMDINEVNINYDAKNAKIEDKVILININNLYYFGISPKKLYEATRKSWVLNKDRANKADYVLSHYHGIVREVYKIDIWQNYILTKKEKLNRSNIETKNQKEKRKAFIGKIASENIRKKYLHTSIKKYFKKGSQNPIKYINI